MIIYTYLETTEEKDEDIPMYRNYIKRALDILLSLAGLILASWLFLLFIFIFIKIYEIIKSKQKFL